MSFKNKTLSEIEKKEKLTFFEKIQLKQIIKQINKKIKEYQKKAQLNKEERKILEKEVLSLLEILEIETEQGEPLNKENIKKITDKELEEVLEQGIKEIKKMI